jgi:hypothetical protein
MIARELIKASALNRKIAQNEGILNSLKKSTAINDEQKSSFVLVRLLYYPKDDVFHEVLIDPEWFHSPELKSDFQHCVKIAKDGFIELLEKDLQLMKEELNELK